MFVDSDDVCDSDIVKLLLQAAIECGVQLSICSLAYLSNNRVRHIDEHRLSGETERTDRYGIINGLYRCEYDNSLFTLPVCKLYDIEFWGEQLNFCKGIIFEDDGLFNRLYKSSYPVAIVNKALHLWRMTPKSVTHKYFQKQGA